MHIIDVAVCYGLLNKCSTQGKLDVARLQIRKGGREYMVVYSVL